MVQVLMSTYNGEKYLRQQIDSVLNQSYKNIVLLIRDDGSTDSTVDILKEYSKKYTNIMYYEGTNIGVQASFFDLMEKVDEKASFIATCDQDDVWFEDKVEVAVTQLKRIEGPGLYCCRTQLTDEMLIPLVENIRKKQPKITFGNAMIENICTGCTMVINRNLYNFVKGKWPQKSVIHDWWFYQVALCFGDVFYDNEPHIYYRQHENNVIGLDSNRFQLIKRQIKSLKSFKGKYTKQMEEFMETFTVEGENGCLVQLLVGTRTSCRYRWKILFNSKIVRQGLVDTILFKGLLFFGWL